MSCIAALLLLGTLTRCYLPDRFTAEVELDADGAVTLGFSGDLVHLVAAWEIAQGRLGPDPPELQAITTALRADRENHMVTRSGARFSFTRAARWQLAPGERAAFPPIGPPLLVVTREADGRMVLQGTTWSPDLRRALERQAIGFSGTLTVRAGAPVLRTNGTRAGTWINRRWQWRFESLRDPAPFLEMQGPQR